MRRPSGKREELRQQPGKLRRRVEPRLRARERRPQVPALQPRAAPLPVREPGQARRPLRLQVRPERQRPEQPEHLQAAQPERTLRRRLEAELRLPAQAQRQRQAPVLGRPPRA